MEIVLVLGPLAVAALVAHLARTVRGDGYGHRPPPPSHAPWWDGTTAGG